MLILKDIHDGESITPFKMKIFFSDSPSPQFNRHGGGGSGGMRPAMSLAQLCNVEPEEAPSSHRLIAQWENIIQQQQEVA